MNTSPHEFAAQHYSPRAQDYLTSAVHAAGEDLDQVEAATRARRPARVLDLGCGGGHVSYRAAPHAGAVVAVDVTAAMLEAVARTAAERGLANIATRLAPAENLPFEDGAFDMVISRFSTHHWQDMAAGLRQARRVLAPTGHALFIDTIAPTDPALDTHLQAIELLRDASHVRNHNLGWWVAAMGGAGFAVTGITRRRLRLDFGAWIARTRTSELHAAAIRSLQTGAPAAVQDYFATEPDGSFTIDCVAITAEPA
jgi:SAM-dependent methyltransferase